MHNQSQTNSNYFQNLDAIPGMKELSDGVAAICSGGADITLYKDADFKGENLELNGNDRIPNLFNFNDKTSSVKVNKGTWLLYPDINFKDEKGGSQAIVLDPGNYNLKQLEAKGLKNDTLSSIQAA